MQLSPALLIYEKHYSLTPTLPSLVLSLWWLAVRDLLCLCWIMSHYQSVMLSGQCSCRKCVVENRRYSPVGFSTCSNCVLEFDSWLLGVVLLHCVPVRLINDKPARIFSVICRWHRKEQGMHWNSIYILRIAVLSWLKKRNLQWL